MPPDAPAWLARVFADGESVQTEPPAFAAADPAVLAVLRDEFARHALDVPGPPVPFDPAAAGAAAALLAAACWRLASGDDLPLPAGPEPRTAAAHLSADVCLRFLPGVFRRARATNDALAADLEPVLRRWPLAGVLADLDGGPDSPPLFAGHPGLQLLYAERLAARPRAGWQPPPGPARDLAERAFAERNVPVPAPTGAPA
jgi:hypothetical protein